MDDDADDDDVCLDHPFDMTLWLVADLPAASGHFQYLLNRRPLTIICGRIHNPVLLISNIPSLLLFLSLLARRATEQRGVG